MSTSPHPTPRFSFWTFRMLKGFEYRYREPGTEGQNEKRARGIRTRDYRIRRLPPDSRPATLGT